MIGIIVVIITVTVIENHCPNDFSLALVGNNERQTDRQTDRETERQRDRARETERAHTRAPTHTANRHNTLFTTNAENKFVYYKIQALIWVT